NRTLKMAGPAPPSAVPTPAARMKRPSWSIRPRDRVGPAARSSMEGQAHGRGAADGAVGEAGGESGRERGQRHEWPPAFSVARVLEGDEGTPVDDGGGSDGGSQREVPTSRRAAEDLTRDPGPGGQHGAAEGQHPRGGAHGP